MTPSATLFNGNYIFWQYQNTDLTGTNAVSYSSLTTIGVTNNDPRLLAATNVTTWFYGWTPQLAPNILTNPVSQSISGGGTATFTVSATGIPASDLSMAQKRQSDFQPDQFIAHHRQRQRE